VVTDVDVAPSVDAAPPAREQNLLGHCLISSHPSSAAG